MPNHYFFISYLICWTKSPGHLERLSIPWTMIPPQGKPIFFGACPGQWGRFSPLAKSGENQLPPVFLILSLFFWIIFLIFFSIIYSGGQIWGGGIPGFGEGYTRIWGEVYPDLRQSIPRIWGEVYPDLGRGIPRYGAVNPPDTVQPTDWVLPGYPQIWVRVSPEMGR